MKGKELRFKRKLLGLSQQELANRCGVTKQTIGNLEHDSHISYGPILRVVDWEIGKAFIEMDIEDFCSNIFSSIKEES